MPNSKVTYRQDLVDNHILLSVEHLKQFFFGGGGYKLKAVHDVSFQIKEGECFGLVGESGCGKTTTGRSIIRLYNITSGSIYYKGYRISGGTRWNEKEIKWSGIHTDTKIKALVLQEKRALKAAKLQGDRNGDKVAKIKALYRSKTAALNLKDDTKASELKAAIASLKLQEKEAIEADKFESQKGETNLEPIKALYEKQITVLKGKVNALMAEHKAAVTALAIQEKKDINLEIAKSKVMLLNLAKQKAIDEPQIADLKAKENEHVAEQKAIIAQINYDNHHVDPALMSEIQMIFQDPVDSLDPRMTVEDIIQEGLHIRHQYNREENHKKCVSMLERVGLIADYASRYPHEFSGGQRQRIGIARALIMDPKFLICDEPISALDVSIRAQIINLLNDLKNEMGLTLMFIAHDLSVVKYFCDRIAVMYFGNLVELAPSDELFAHPLHPYTRALLSAIPKPDPLSEKNRVRKIYNPAKEHDYSVEKPVLQEILPGHWILANAAEMAKYREMIKVLDVKNAAKEKIEDQIDQQVALQEAQAKATGAIQASGYVPSEKKIEDIQPASSETVKSDVAKPAPKKRGRPAKKPVEKKGE